jgi:hypothetical protein
MSDKSRRTGYPSSQHFNTVLTDQAQFTAIGLFLILDLGLKIIDNPVCYDAELDL